MTEIVIYLLSLQYERKMTLIDTDMKRERSTLEKVLLALLLFPVFLILVWQDQLP